MSRNAAEQPEEGLKSGLAQAVLLLSLRKRSALLLFHLRNTTSKQAANLPLPLITSGRKCCSLLLLDFCGFSFFSFFLLSLSL